MKYKQYGDTGCRVSAIGFGGMRLNLERSLEENGAIVHHAFERGINYFDTAPGYLDDWSEPIFGQAFKTMPRGEFFVSTKMMPHAAKTAQEAYKQVERSLERMGIDYIDFFHVWCLRTMEQYRDAMRPDGLYEGLMQAKQAGLIRHISFSSHQEGHEVRQVVDSGNFAGVLLGLNILNFPYRWEGVLAAQRAGMGVVAMNPLSGGMIPQNEDKLQWLVRRPGDTPTDAALRFMIGVPEVSVALVGFTDIAHIDQVCRIADQECAVDAEEFDAIKALLSQRFSNAACTTCGYCQECPKGILIPPLMQYYNAKAIFGTPDEELIKNWQGNREWGILANNHVSPAECVACGRCERICTQKLPIISRLREIAAWEAKSKELNAK